MATQIELQDAMSLKDPAGNPSFLDLRFAILTNISQGAYSYDMFGVADGEITGVGSVLYRILHYPKTVAYTGNIATQNVVVETREVKIDTKRCIGWEIEDMDLAQIILSPSLQATQAANAAEAIRADKNAQLMLKVKAHLAEHPELTYYFPELVSEADMTTDQYRSIQKKLLVKRTKMSMIMNELYINVNPSEFFGIITPMGIANFELLLTALNISNASFDMTRYGIGGMGKSQTVASIGGTPFISDPFLGGKVAYGESFNGDYAYDMEDIIGLFMYRGALAYPAKWGKMGILPNPANLNSMFKAKWFTGFGWLRPELICGFTKSFRYEDEVDVAVGATYEIKHSDMGNRTITATSSATSYATVAVVGGKVQVTGVAAGSSTITIKLGEDTIGTVDVTVA